MRPASIRKFDLFYLGSLALSALVSLLGFGAIQQQAEAELQGSGVSVGSSFIVVSIVVGLLIALLLWYLVSRKGFVIAKWVLVLFFAYGLVGLPGMFAGGITAMEALSLVGVVLQAVAVWFLFQPDARAWFAGDRTATPEDPED